MFGQTEERTSVGDQTGTHQLTHHAGKVGSDGVHAVVQIFEQLGTVGGDVGHLVTELLNVFAVSVGNFGTHRHFGGLFDALLNVFGKDVGQIRLRAVGTEACTTTRTNSKNREILVMVWNKDTNIYAVNNKTRERIERKRKQQQHSMCTYPFF